MLRKEESRLSKVFKECRPLLWGAFWFGLFINLLMLSAPIYSLQVLDRVLSSGSLDTLLMLTLIVAVALIFMGILQVLRSMVFSHIGRWLDDRLSSDIVADTVEITTKNPAIGSQPIRDLNVVRSFVTSQHLATLFDAPWAIIYFIVIYAIHVYLGIAVTLGAVLLLILAFMAERLPSKLSASANDEQVRSMQALEAILRNAEVVKSMGLFSNATSKWRYHNQTWLQNVFGSSNISIVISQITRTLRLSIQTLTMCLGAYLALSNLVTPGAIIAVSILSARALAPFDAAAPLYQSLVGVRKAVRRLLEMEETLADYQSALNNNERITLPEAKGAVTLEKVTFETVQSKRWILQGINVRIQAGESVGIIGPSGSGKTTLARLLVGVLLPTTGAVRLDGAALHQWEEEQLGRSIGYLPQSVELFDGSIAQNIARLNPQPDEAAIVEAAQHAMVHEAILAFPNGYATEIGPNGSLLSAGQRQRIALARCFYGGPKLIVMDEPNANLDGEGEMAFVNALKNAKKLGITTITIAHRPSVLQHVDKILVLQAGKAKHFGPAKEVMAELASENRKVQPLRREQNSA